MTIDDVRKALKEAYDTARKHPDWEGGKSSEAHCSVHYPSIYQKEPFSNPYKLDVYSYALGPSREHYFIRADKEAHPNYYTWEAPDIFAKAVEVISGWAAEYGREYGPEGEAA